MKLRLSVKAALLCAAALVGTAAPAAASPIVLTWITTVQSVSGAHPGIVGETLTTTITVDNGGSSIFSQNWTTANFVSYRQTGASGWFLSSTSFGSGSGSFTTDATGAVLTAGNWVDNYPVGPVTTSWAGATLGGWWNNGQNETSCVTTPQACVFANNVADNLVSRNWTASTGTPAAVPEPGTFLLLGAGLVAAGARWRLKKRA